MNLISLSCNHHFVTYSTYKALGIASKIFKDLHLKSIDGISPVDVSTVVRRCPPQVRTCVQDGTFVIGDKTTIPFNLIHCGNIRTLPLVQQHPKYLVSEEGL